MSDIVPLPASHDSMIVGVGASAGGLEAFSQLLRLVPKGANLSFVFIQHLDPTLPSALCETLAGLSAMPIRPGQAGYGLWWGQCASAVPCPPGSLLSAGKGRHLTNERKTLPVTAGDISRFACGKRQET